VLEAASIKHGARAASTMRALMEAWGRCDGVIRPQGYSTFGMSAQDIQKMEQRTIRNPALTLLAMTTPESFFDSVGSSAARDGFLNRFLIVESDIGRQPGRHIDAIPVHESVIDWVASVNTVDTGIATGPDMMPAPKVVPFAKTALDAFKCFEVECIGLMDAHDDDGLAEMFGRSNEIAMRLSLIIAVGCQAEVIEQAHANWAIQYVRQHALRTVERLKTSVADSEFEQLTNQVHAEILKARERGLTEREINQRCRKFRALDQRGKLNVLNTMAFTGDIQRVEFPPAGGRGGKRISWIAVDNPET
jgi:hypothetical protein